MTSTFGEYLILINDIGDEMCGRKHSFRLWYLSQAFFFFLLLLKISQDSKINNLFKEKYNADFISLPDQPGNYRETLRENDDTLDKLKWKPSDRLKEYIDSL